MKKLQLLLIAAAMGGVAATGGLAQAQSGHDGHHAATPVASKPAKAGEMTEGEVRKIDKEGKKITLKHGPIKNLDMPAMTMVFVAADPALLEKVKVGEKVRFVATNPGGKLTVTDIQPVQ
jgi:Cu(I)/Ag(I) efflux system periplasmic protein CusF